MMQDDIKMPLVSVVLPIYNVENYLERCVKSVCMQTYSNLEILLIDDGSTDSSGKMCDKFATEDKRIRVFHKKNGGLSDARNYGIKKARAELISFIDSDDFVDRDYIQYLYQLISKYDTDMAICQHRVCFKNKKKKDYGAGGDIILSNKKCIEKMLYHDVIDTSAWAKLYKIKLFDNVQYPKGKWFEDIATTYALMLKCEKIAVGLESKYNYILRPDSIVNSEFKLKKMDLLEMTDQMAADILKIYPDLEKAVLRRQVYARFSTLNQMLYTENYLQEKKNIIKFVKENSWKVFWNVKTPFRDKIAIVLLLINYRLYKSIWLRCKC